MTGSFRVLAIVVLVAFLAACSDQATPTPNPTSAPTPHSMPTACAGPSLTIGEISDDAKEVIESVQPLADYLAKRLASHGIVCGQVVVRRTVGLMIGLINRDEVDIYFDSVFPATLVSDAAGAEPILRRWRNCDPEYYSVIFTTKTSGINSIQDLAGHSIAMDRPDSTSGLVMPAVYLIDHGIHLVVKHFPGETVPAGAVGIDFTYDDQNTHARVLAGDDLAGATDDFNYDQWGKKEPGALLKLAEMGPEPRQAVLVRADLDGALKSAIKDELLKAQEDADGRAALESASKTCKFDDTPDGIEAAFARMRAMRDTMKMVPRWEEALWEAIDLMRRTRR